MAAAAVGGKVECIKLLQENGIEVDEWISSEAARGGNLDCFIYVQGFVKKLSSSDFNAAASSGSVECLKYIHQVSGVDCGWTSLTTKFAAQNGKLDVYGMKKHVRSSNGANLIHFIIRESSP